MMEWEQRRPRPLLFLLISLPASHTGNFQGAQIAPCTEASPSHHDRTSSLPKAPGTSFIISQENPLKKKRTKIIQNKTPCYFGKQSLFHSLSSGVFCTSQGDLTAHCMSPEHKLRALQVEECLPRNRKDPKYTHTQKRKIMSSHDGGKEHHKTSHARVLADKNPACIAHSFGLGYT